MSPKRGRRPSQELKAVSSDRASRLFRLLRLLEESPQSRAQLARKLRLDVRGFYRDLELLRASGIRLPLDNGQYRLQGSFDAALARLPFPDPRLTLGEALVLAKGRTPTHRKLRAQVDTIIR
jgi:predicted DNA-binding transcriptional regulator YafY